MRHLRHGTALAAVFTAVFATSAVAAPEFTITLPTTIQEIPDNTSSLSDNNFHDQLDDGGDGPGGIPGFGLQDIGFGGMSISLNEDAIATFTFFGKEAGFANSFTYSDTFGSASFGPVGGDVFDDSVIGDNDGDISPSNEQVGFTQSPATAVAGMNHLTLGPEDFSFDSNNGVPASFGDNGFGVFLPSTAFSGGANTYTASTLFFGYDDAGAREDNNHDDFILSVSLQESPERIPMPASLALLGGSLMGLGVVSRLRRKPTTSA